MCNSSWTLPIASKPRSVHHDGNEEPASVCIPKKTANNSFWLIFVADVEVRRKMGATTNEPVDGCSAWLYYMYRFGVDVCVNEDGSENEWADDALDFRDIDGRGDVLQTI